MNHVQVTGSAKASSRALSDADRQELELYRQWLPRISQVCADVTEGNLESRILGCDVGGELGTIATLLNRFLDITDAFVREAQASLQAAGEGRFHRRVLTRGLPGTFRHAANVTNSLNDNMRVQARTIQEQRERERTASEELSAKVEAILTVVNAAAQGDLTQEVPISGSDAIGQMGEGLDKFFRDLRESIGSITSSARTLAGAAEELTALSQQMSNDSDETTTQANTVSAASEEVSKNVQTVAAATEQMNASVREIAKNAAEGARVATAAVNKATATNATVARLGESGAEIGKVIKVITSVAQQTNLLALNATIEAARAGEAGKGFAVVANEVKELAKTTARATEDIGRKIDAIQADTSAAAAALGEITGVIGQIHQIQTTIAAAVEQQSATTNEISRNVAEGAKGTGEIAQNITGVAKAAENTSRGASKGREAARTLANLAGELQKLVAQFRC